MSPANHNTRNQEFTMHSQIKTLFLLLLTAWLTPALIRSSQTG